MNANKQNKSVRFFFFLEEEVNVFYIRQTNSVLLLLSAVLYGREASSDEVGGV